ncbi:hypothetical protein ACFSOZ_26730 [Mesorhizobium newzealandense]|uniref:Uncharacterized protein n=1 Tax=Mesorhizobium newzealandense TaxID=1300302 RepID=A0ABW4UG77_9HYPH
METGRNIVDSPAGTFFYVAAVYLRFRSGDPFPSDRGEIGQALPSQKLYYELQHRADGRLYLIAFASETDADRLRSLVSGQEFKAILSPQIWGAQTSLVELPIERLTSLAARELQLDADGNSSFVLDVAVD